MYALFRLKSSIRQCYNHVRQQNTRLKDTFHRPLDSDSISTSRLRRYLSTIHPTSSTTENNGDNLPSHANVVVVGGGVIGTSVAYHLSKLGVEDVLLLEKDKLTSGTTWHAAGLINTFGSLSGTSTSFRMYTKELYSTILPEETSMDTGFIPIGFIELACDEHRLEYYRRVAAFNRLCGVMVEELNPHQVKDKFPLLDTTDVLAGFYVADDGRANPYDVTMALAKGAKMNGVLVRENVAVSGVTKTYQYNASDPSSHDLSIKQRIPKVTGVVLEDGKVIEANSVVNCTGMWARQFGELCGVTIPNQAAEHYYLITDQMEAVDPDWPVVEDSSRCVYIRPEGGGLMFGLFERMGAAWNVDKIPDFSFGEIEPDWDRMGDCLEDAMMRVPNSMTVGAKKFFCGPESFTPDGCPAVGESPDLRGYFVAAGLNSLGITTGGGIGRMLAQWIRDSKAPNDVDITGINVDRFHKFQNNPQYRASRAGEILGETYKVHYPDKDLKSCRNVKKSIFHDRLREKHAYFRDVSGWESPSWYGDKANPTIDDMNFGRQNFFEHWEREHLACRNNVALFDMSFMSKFLVQGDEAGDFLNYLSTANINNDGMITYTQWLSEDGKMEADLTVTKMDHDRFLVVATDTMHNHVRAHMEKYLSSDKHVFVTDVTGSYAQLNIQGPNSRKLLQTLTSVNLDEFPFRSAIEIDIGMGRALCNRITYVGELGYELFIPVEFALHVYDAIIEEGREFAMEHAGLRALGSLRMEKGYRDYGHDMDNTDTLLECGLGFTCDFNKSGGFIGMESVLSQKAQAKIDGGLKRRMAQVMLLDSDPFLHHGEVVWRDGVRVSEVRSASYGHHLGGAVGLTMLECKEPINKEFIEKGEWEVEVGNKMIPCKISLAPLYDRRNERIKA